MPIEPTYYIPFRWVFRALFALFLIASTIIGHTSGGKLCPIPSMITNSAPGMELAVSSPPVTGTSGSSLP
jgi:hypothetical protein